MNRRVLQILKAGLNPLKRCLFLRLVGAAYRRPGGVAHSVIKSIGRRECGVERIPDTVSAFCQGFLDCVYQAQLGLFQSNRSGDWELGTAEIGFKGLRIHCTAANANSSTVFLIGKERNQRHFDVYRELARPGTAAIDIGANLGIHSLVLSACVGGSGRVLAFEPLPSIRGRLEENLQLNAVTNVKLSAAALGSAVGTVSFFSNTGDFNIGKGRVQSDGDLSVLCSTIDHEFGDIRLQVSLIKIDTEGHELEVLKGAAGLLLKHRPAIVMEFNRPFYSQSEIQALIPPQYSCFEIPSRSSLPFRLLNNTWTEGADVLIVPDEKIGAWGNPA